MGKFYSRIDDTRGGFFDSDIHGQMGSPGCTIPNGAREITDELHAGLVAAQSDGKLIIPDPDGYPVAIDPPPLDVEALESIERAWRDGQLTLTDPLVSRHRDEVEQGDSTTLSAEQYTELQAYRRQLRDWPQGTQFPLIEHRPTEPEWLAENTQ
ncbi:phage tail assembly chaperone [Pseudomonas sp. Tul1A2]|uniref:phage tail assembly chaperone n=1 Tax=Pseudomonas sp. IT-P395 TaxID=3026459 RepID=UPI0039DFC47F